MIDTLDRYLELIRKAGLASTFASDPRWRVNSPERFTPAADCSWVQQWFAAAKPEPLTFAGFPIVVDPALPDDVIEFRDADGRLLLRQVLG